jgi:hypothetical protein
MLDISTVAQIERVKEAHSMAERASRTKTGQGVVMLNDAPDPSTSSPYGDFAGQALVVLPFKASVLETGQRLTIEQALAMRNRGQAQHLRIERSYPGAPEAIGWTVFERTAHAYLHKNEPLFLHEKGARRHIRKVYAIRQDLNDDILTVSQLYR